MYDIWPYISFPEISGGVQSVDLGRILLPWSVTEKQFQFKSLLKLEKLEKSPKGYSE